MNSSRPVEPIPVPVYKLLLIMILLFAFSVLTFADELQPLRVELAPDAYTYELTGLTVLRDHGE